jgi:hypothetical protein
MYKETGKFLLHISRQKAVWKDGELWTSAAISFGMGYWVHRDPTVADGIKDQLGDILTISSIIFGFVITTLALYAEVTSGWSKEQKVRRVIGKIVDWQVWSVLCLMVQIGYIIALRLVDGRINLGLHCRPLWFGILTFLTAYAGFQIWNHTLVVWWAFRDPSKLETKQESPKEEYADHAAH